MHFDILAQSISLGLLQGGVYALVAAGLTLIYGVTRIVNFAHAEFVTFGMYLSVFCFTYLGLAPYPALVLIIPFVILVGMIIERVIIRPAANHPPINQMLITIGLSIMMLGLMQLIWGANTQVVPLSYAREAVTVFGVRLTVTRILAFAAAMIVAIGFWLFLERSRIGMAIRAVAQRSDAAELMGINTKLVHTVTFGLGLGLAALGGALISPTLPIYPTVGIDLYLLPAFVIVILGTMGNFAGALLGGLIIGLAEGLGGYFVGSSLKQLISLSIFIGVLLFMPRGLFGKS